MSKWLEVPIGDVAHFVGGGTPTRSNPDYYGGDIPWITPKDMKFWNIEKAQISITQKGLDNSTSRLIPEGSVLIVVRSGVLKHTIPVGLNRLPVAINQDMKALICSDAVIPDYLARFIKGSSGRILTWVRATTADNFPIDNLKNLFIPLPPLSEQRRIADILDRADALRAERRKAIALLDDLAQSIFIEMFGDPVLNPYGWPIRTVGDLIDSAKYGTSEKAVESGDLPVLRMGNVTATGEVDLRDLKYMPDSSVDERYLVRHGDILFNRTNSADLVGKTAIYRGTAPLAYAGYLVRVRTNPNNHPEYLAAFMNTAYIKRVLRNMCKSIIGMANINARELQTIRIAEPPLDLQNAFAERIASVNALKAVHRMHLAGLDALFESLQQRAFRGDLWDNRDI
ncbi:restriction endonuclease subunit S [Nonomuraea sp. NPDC001023]|uniref:restriction endonuclease subunit S n=1 Tax=unclassified Nonomuraea TaxID=2593643 RepID=UPI00332239CD